jgi:hypothetical protein
MTNIQQQQDLQQQPPMHSPFHNLMQEGTEQQGHHQLLHPNYEVANTKQPSQQELVSPGPVSCESSIRSMEKFQEPSTFMNEQSTMISANSPKQQQQQQHAINNALMTAIKNNQFNPDQMQDFLLKNFLKSNEDFKQPQQSHSQQPVQQQQHDLNFLLQNNQEFFLQYYKMNQPNQMEPVDEKQLTLDFLVQFYQLNEFKKKFQQDQQEIDLRAISVPLTDDQSVDHTGDDDDDVTAIDLDKPNISDSPQIYGKPMSNGSDSVKSASSNSNKRLRTTILPEQLNFLYECYQTESNPSRKMLEEIAKKVNLKKRVVQVRIFYYF